MTIDECEAREMKTGNRGQDLPAKFAQEERDAYDWLYDCRIEGCGLRNSNPSLHPSAQAPSRPESKWQ